MKDTSFSIQATISFKKSFLHRNNHLQSRRLAGSMRGGRLSPACNMVQVAEAQVRVLCTSTLHLKKKSKILRSVCIPERDTYLFEATAYLTDIRLFAHPRLVSVYCHPCIISTNQYNLALPHQRSINVCKFDSRAAVPRAP